MHIADDATRAIACPTVAGNTGRPHFWDSPQYGPRLYCQYAQPDDADAVTAQTISFMRELVRGDLTIDWFGQLAAAVAGTGPVTAQLDRIFYWVKSHVTYHHDESGPWSKSHDFDEVLTGPAELITSDRPSEDCDGFAMLTAALCIAVGISAQFKTIAADPTAPDSFSHVYAVAFTPNGPYALDTSNGPAPGWEYPRPTRAKLWPIKGKILNMPRRQATSQLGSISDAYLDPTYSDPTTDSSSIDWNRIISQAFTTATPILKAQYGTPQLAPGTFYSTTPNGASTMYAVPTGQSLSLPGTAAAISSSTLLLVGGGLLLMVVLMSARH